MKCRDFETQFACYNDGVTNQTLIAHYQYGKTPSGNFEIIETQYTDISGVAVDTTGGTVIEGQCLECCPSLQQSYLCIDGVHTSVWVSIDPQTLVINTVLNALTLAVIDPAEYVTGFISDCASCSIVADREGESYGSFFGGFSNFTDLVEYNSSANDAGCAIALNEAATEYFFRVRVFDAPGNMTSDTILNGYQVDVSGASYYQFLNDISALTQSLGVTFLPRVTPINGNAAHGHTLQYNSTTNFAITVENGLSDGAGGVCWSNVVKWGMSYEDGVDITPVDSVHLLGDSLNGFDVSWNPTEFTLENDRAI